MAKIMLVEDDTNLSEIYAARMAAEGYQIVSARDGEEALALAAKEKPDLIISDVMMPKISGFEMLDILRNTEGLKSTRVIMLTALGQAEDKTRATTLGADRYLVKSQVTLEDIVKAAQELLSDNAPAPVATPATASTPPRPAAAQPQPPRPTAPPMPKPAAATSPPALDPPAAPTIPPLTPPATSLAVPLSARGTGTPATTPVSAPARPMTRPSQPTVTPMPVRAAPPALDPKQPDSTQAANAKLVTDAVEDLMETADKKPEPPAATATPATSTPPPTPPVAAPDDQSDKPQTTNDNVTIAGKKVIKPISDDLNAPKKPSLDALVAEAAKNEAKVAAALAAHDQTEDKTDRKSVG